MIVFLDGGVTVPQKSNTTLIKSINNNVTNRCSLFFMGGSFFFSNTKNCIHLLATANVHNATVDTVVSIDANDGHFVAGGTDDFLGSTQ